MPYQSVIMHQLTFLPHAASFCVTLTPQTEQSWTYSGNCPVLKLPYVVHNIWINKPPATKWTLYCCLWMPATLSGGPLRQRVQKATYCTESCGSNNQEMDCVAEMLQQHTLTKPRLILRVLRIHSNRKWSAVHAMTGFPCACLRGIQMVLDAIQAAEHEHAEPHISAVCLLSKLFSFYFYYQSCSLITHPPWDLINADKSHRTAALHKNNQPSIL